MPPTSADPSAAGSVSAGGVDGSGVLRGDQWDVDRMNHLHDLPRFCPDCGSAINDDTGIAIEYWQANKRVYHTWCRMCGWAGDIARIRRMVGPEPAD